MPSQHEPTPVLTVTFKKHVTPIGVKARLPRVHHVVPMPPMKVRGLGTPPLTSACEKSKPACSCWKRSSSRRFWSRYCCMMSPSWPRATPGHGSPSLALSGMRGRASVYISLYRMKGEPTPWFVFPNVHPQAVIEYNVNFCAKSKVESAAETAC